MNGEEELNANITKLEEALGKPLSIPQLTDDQMVLLREREHGTAREGGEERTWSGGMRPTAHSILILF